MLQKLYSEKSEKSLKKLFEIYAALLIVSGSLLVLTGGYSYFSSSNFQIGPSIAFAAIIFWSALNVNFLKKKVKK